MTKKLNPKAFWPILCGVGAGAIMMIVNIIVALTIGGGMQGYIDEAMKSSRQELDEEMIAAVANFTKVFMILIFLAVLAIYAYFILKTLKNRKQKITQGYITALLVLNCLGIFFNIFSIADPLSMISIVINATIVAGCVMQKRYVEPVNYEEDELLPKNDTTPPPSDVDVFPGH